MIGYRPVVAFVLIAAAIVVAVEMRTAPKPDLGGESVRPASSVVANTRYVQITLYGSYDKGSLTVSYPVLHSQVGGVGSYTDPLTFASPTGRGEYQVGARIYVPSLRKYFIREDSCGCGPVTHVALYIGNPSATNTVLWCEGRLTPPGPAAIVLDPPPGLILDLVPMWSQSTGTCHASSKR